MDYTTDVKLDKDFENPLINTSGRMRRFLSFDLD